MASYFLVLDFDGGDLTPEAFEDIFWRKVKKGQRHPFIIHSTFNRRAENPNKFHVILPYKRPARSFEEHRAVYDYIVWRLEEAGYTEKSLGLDHLSKAANQPFWIPTVNRAHPEFAFFRTFGTKSRDFNRYALDPELCPKEEWSPPSERKTVWVPQTGEKLKERIEAAEQRLWGMSHNRHRPFFEYAVLLALARLDEFEIEAKLEEVAGSEPHMRKKVAGAMRSLKKYRRI